MKGGGKKNGPRQNQIVSNKGYNTSPSPISILSEQFGIVGNLTVSSSIRTSYFAASTLITSTFQINNLTISNLITNSTIQTTNLSVSNLLTTSTIQTTNLSVSNLLTTSTIQTKNLSASTITLNDISSGMQSILNTSNSVLFLNNVPVTSGGNSNINPDITVSTIRAISTITNNITFNTQKPIRIYADNDKYIFTATGEDQYFTVPTGVNEINLKLWGAAGRGKGLAYGESFGGRGGFVSGTLAVTPGQEFTVVVGKQGQYLSGTGGSSGGYGGGGNGAYGGGGRSALTDGTVDLVTAGGGGGGGGGQVTSWGGCGGNYSGGNAQSIAGYLTVGGGGTQTSGGIGAVSLIEFTPYVANYQGSTGTQNNGGDGATCSTINSIATYVSTSAGGGGGGYYGGGGGGGSLGLYRTNFGEYHLNYTGVGGAGGGGSSYLENLSNAIGIAGDNYSRYISDPDFQKYANLNDIIYPGFGDGLVIISYPSNLQLEYTDSYTKIAVSQASIPKNGWIAGGAGANYGGNYNLQYSADGLTWTYVNNGDFPGPTNGIAFNGTQWAAVFSLSTVTSVATGPTSSIQLSTDGLNWTQITSGGFSNGYGIVYGSTIWTAVGEKSDTTTSIQTSIDGLDWLNTNNSFDNTGYGVSFNGSMWVAVGKSLTNTKHTIKYCIDGSNWSNSTAGGFTAAPSPPYYNTYYPNFNGLAVATNNLGGIKQMWVAVGGAANSRSTIQYSTDGSNWSGIATGGFVGFGRGIAYGNGLWVATGDTTYNSTNPQQTIQWSSNTSNWSSSITGGFTFSGTSVAFNGKTWIATGIDSQQNSYIQTSTDGSNWSGVNSVASLNNPNCVSPGIIDILQVNNTFLTNNEVITNIVTANSVNSTSINGNNIYASSINVSNNVTTEIATISSFTANYGNVGDFYTYSYVKNILVAGINNFVAIGSSKNKKNSIQFSVDGSIWYGVNSGGFSPTITYEQTRITNSTQPKAILYNTTSTFFVAYGITDESINAYNFTNTIQYSDSNDISTWYSYTGLNTLSMFILENINNALYTNGKYMLLTSIFDNPILISDSMGEFYLGSQNNRITYSNSTNTASSLSVAYGFYQETNKTYIVGMARNSDTSRGNSPIFYTTNGSNLQTPPNIQSNLPPIFYDITKDKVNNILFAVGPGISNGTTSLSTLMYSSNDGITWADGGLEGVISARSVSYASTIRNNIVVACESTSSSNTVISYSYSNIFSPYVSNTLTSNVITMLYSTDNGSNWSRASTGGFSNVGYGVAYNPALFGVSVGGWMAVGSGVSTIIYSADGSNWSNASNGFDIAGYGINKNSNGLNLVVGRDSIGYKTKYGAYNALQSMSGTTFDDAGYDIYIKNDSSFVVAVGEGINSGTILYNTVNYSTLKNDGVTGAFDIAGYGVFYGNNLWVAVGKSFTTSKILYSQNGSNWSNASSGSFDIQGQGVIYRDVPQSTLWVAVGSGVATNNILYSTNGSNWFNANTNTFSNIGYGVTWNGTNFVAVGDSGILLSRDGSNWSSPQSGNFSSQSTIGSGRVTILESYGRGITSGPAGFLVAVGRAESTNRRYEWSNISQIQPTSGFNSDISENGINIQPTYIATKSVYDPTFGNFIVGGLTNNPLNSIINSQDTSINSWQLSQQNYFDAVNEKQFINSGNASIVGQEITTNNLYASNGYITNSLNVNKYIYTQNINASNILTSNITSSNIYSSNIITNQHDANNINANFIRTNYTSSANILASSITVGRLNFNSITGNSTIFTNLVGTSADITTLMATNINANIIRTNYTSSANIVASSITVGRLNFNSITGNSTIFTNLVGTSADITTLMANNTNADIIRTNYTSSANIVASSITVGRINFNSIVGNSTIFTNLVGTSANITTLMATNTTINNLIANDTVISTITVKKSTHSSIDTYHAILNNLTATSAYITTLSTNSLYSDLFKGNGSGLSNVTANSLVDTATTYSIPNTDIVAKNITGIFTGSFTGTVNSTGPLSDNIINANTINVSTLNTIGDIFLGYNGTRSGIINGNGSGLSNVIASSLVPTTDQVITANFTATNVTATGIVSATTVNASGTVTAASVTAGTAAATTVNATNITATNDITATRDVIATRNVTAANVTASGTVSATTVNASGTVTAANVSASGTSAAVTVSATNITATNDITATRDVIATRNVTATTVTATTVTASGTVTGTSVTATGTATANTLNATNITATNDITATRTVSASNVTATGNVTALRFIGDGSLLTGLSLPTNVTYAINASNASNATNAINATYATYATNAGPNGFTSEGEIRTTKNILVQGYRPGASGTQEFVSFGFMTSNGIYHEGFITALGEIRGDSITCINKLTVSGYIDSRLIINTGNIQSGSFSATGNINAGNDIYATSNIYARNITASGNISAASFITSSDERLKSNIEPLQNTLSSIKQLQGVKYNLKSSPSDKKSIGFIAQELEKFFPEFVSTDETEEKMKSVSYGNITAVLIEAIKEQQSLIESQQSTINAILKKYPL